MKGFIVKHEKEIEFETLVDVNVNLYDGNELSMEQSESLPKELSIFISVGDDDNSYYENKNSSIISISELIHNKIQETMEVGMHPSFEEWDKEFVEMNEDEADDKEKFPYFIGRYAEGIAKELNIIADEIRNQYCQKSGKYND